MKRVLIVDDSLAVARQMENILTAAGDFTVSGHAKNGSLGLKMFMAGGHDIVCMDMNMPEMDGLTALRTLMALNPNSKVVMITSLGGVGDNFNEAIKHGAKAVISKPFETEQVLVTLRSL
jgi:two-component system chemotaxis response regulator CheY